jgi:hypothetical protein
VRSTASWRRPDRLALHRRAGYAGTHPFGDAVVALTLRIKAAVVTTLVVVGSVSLAGGWLCRQQAADRLALLMAPVEAAPRADDGDPGAGMLSRLACIACSAACRSSTAASGQRSDSTHSPACRVDGESASSSTAGGAHARCASWESCAFAGRRCLRARS